jgi:hypothetical protein
MTWLHLAAFGKTCHASFATDARAFSATERFISSTTGTSTSVTTDNIKKISK